MSITITQLQALSEEFNFDLAEARAFLGHAEPKKRGRPPKDSDSDSDDEKSVTKKSESGSKANAKTKTTTKVESPRAKRAPTGYQLFMVNISDKVQKELKATAKDGKPARGAFVTKVAKRWKALSEKQQVKWNTKAKDAV